MSNGLNLCWALAAAAIGEQVGSPIPREVVDATIGDWKLRLNNTGADQGDMPRYSIQAEHLVYFVVGVFDPAGGYIGGCDEAKFIAAMRAALPAGHPFLED